MAITAKTAIAQSPSKFNIYLQEQGKVIDGVPQAYALVMPDEDGTLPDFVMQRKTGLIVSWPVNPHSSGETAILQRLDGNVGAPVECTGFAKDQDGRWFKKG